MRVQVDDLVIPPDEAPWVASRPIWVEVEPRAVVGTGVVYHDEILGGWSDGWPHRRLQSGGCMSCMAAPNEEHRAVWPTRTPDTPIYNRLAGEQSWIAKFRLSLFMQGYGPKTIDAAVVFMANHRRRMGL